MIDAATRVAVRRRADERCEYCRLPEAAVPSLSFHVEHVVAQQHRSDDSPDNLALACDRCNAYKGTNLSSIDPESGGVVELYHPRRDRWSDHFEFDGAVVVGRSPAGRATVRLLVMNAPRRVELRQAWLADGNNLD